MSTDELSGALQRIARAAKSVGIAITAAAAGVGAYRAAIEKETEFYRTLQAEATNRDPIAELLQAVDFMEAQAQITELAELIDDIPLLPPPKILRPPKYLGPVNKANHTASRPPRRARSSCYKHHR